MSLVMLLSAARLLRASLALLLAGLPFASPASAQGFGLPSIPGLPGILNELGREAQRHDLQQRQIEQTPSMLAVPRQERPTADEQQLAMYQSDGVTLGRSLDQMPISGSLNCSDSQKHPGMQLCTDQDAHSVLSVIVNKTRKVAYFSRYLGPVKLTMPGVHKNMAHLTALFGTPRIIDEITANDGSYSVIASWGQLSFSPAPPDTGAIADHGMYIQYPRRASNSTEDARIFHVSNGPGFYYLASYNREGMGVVRYGAYSDKMFTGAPDTVPGSFRSAETSRGGHSSQNDLPVDEQGSMNYSWAGINLSAPFSAHNFQCNESDKYPDFKVCDARVQNMLVIVNPAGRVAYFDAHPDYRLTRLIVSRYVHDFSIRYGEPHVLSEIVADDGSYSVLLTWGSLVLAEADNDQAVNKMYVSYLMRTKAGGETPQLYSFDKGAGFFLTASFDSMGQGSFRYGAYNDRTFKDARSIADAAAEPIFGEWVGSATCERSQRDLSLSVQSTSSANFGATVAFFNDADLATPVPHLQMLARQEGSAGTYRFVPSHANDKLSFTATLSQGNTALDVSSSTCGSFTLTRPDILPAPALARGSLPRDLYHESDPLALRCKAIMGWASRIAKEYPGTDLHHTPMEKLYPKAVLLFSDYDFVPTFGYQYDPFNVPNGYSLGAIGHDITRGCGDDPFIREDGADFWGNPLFQSAFLSKVVPFSIYDNGSFQVSAIRHFVQTARSVQTVIAKRLADRSPGSSGSITGLIDINTYITNHAMYLWPSDLADLSNNIKASIQHLAVIEKTRELEQLKVERDPLKGLAAARAFVSGNPTSAIENLASTDRDKLVGELDALSHQFSAALFAPFQREIEKVSNDLSGVRKLSDISVRAKETLAQFPEQDRQSMTALLTKKINGILAALVAADLNNLRLLPSGYDGLRASCNWINTYNIKYADVLSEDPVQDGLSAFADNRATKLIGALPEAKEELGKTEPAQTAQLQRLREYLCWAGDRKLPESLEYDFVAADRGIGVLWQ